MRHTEVIQHYVNKYDSCLYLEIGLGDLSNFNSIQCMFKHGVDPDPVKELPAGISGQVVYRMTSDAFFRECDPEKGGYDVIFLDGLHHADQLQRDIEGALANLNEGGVIIVHDINPYNEEMTIVPRQTKQWTGNVYKTWYTFNRRVQGAEIITLAEDFGIGIIKPSPDFKLTKVAVKNITFKEYQEWIKEQFTQL